MKVIPLENILTLNIQENIISEEEENEKNRIYFNNLNLPFDLSSRLYEHQRCGVAWLYKCFIQQSGGLLGDDMGLGKTFQVVTLICALLRMKLIKNALVLCPVSVLENWKREFDNFLVPFVDVSCYSIAC
jgi:SNF2 family DNA or RNA helicase